MEYLNFDRAKEGSFDATQMRSGIWFEGNFYEFGSIEYNNLMLFTCNKEEYKNTLLGLLSEIVTADIRNITNQN